MNCAHYCSSRQEGECEQSAEEKAASCRTTRIINLCHSRGPALVSLHHLFPERSAASSYTQLSHHTLHQQPSSLETNILIFFRPEILVHLHPISSTFALHLLF